MMRKSKPLDALMSRTRQAILIATVLQPQRWWYLSDLAQHIGVPPSSLQRDLAAMTEVGILDRRKDGNRVYYRADPECPFLPDLRGLLVKTAGLVEVLLEALEPFLPGIDFAFIYGSVARSDEVSESDVDLMLIGAVGLADMALALRQAEKQLQRAINPVLLTWPEFVGKRSERQHFLMTVLNAAKLYLKGSDHELDTAYGRAESEGAHHELQRAG
jgi:DNA-binding transcriptional ArsR family regulator